VRRCARFASAVTTLGLIFLRASTRPAPDFEARMALLGNPAYVLRLWVYLLWGATEAGHQALALVGHLQPRTLILDSNAMNMAETRPVVVIGGTRGTGLLIARLLDQSGASVRVLARDPDKAKRELGASIQVVMGDVTKEGTLVEAIDGARAIVFTAGCRSGRLVSEAQIRATEYQGVLNTLGVARQVGFSGRFLYMTSSGIGMRSFWTRALNIYKGNTLVWRARAEDAIRASGLPYTIIRTGMLLNRPGGLHTIELTQRSLPLLPRYRIARTDVAEAFVAALEHPRAVRATFEIVWGRKGHRQEWGDLMTAIVSDAPSPTTHPRPDQEVS
jgi:uncharacterized protein YbjT (DUF2867 family)